MATLLTVYPADQAKPIVFLRNASAQVIVQGEFPPYAKIAAAILGSNSFETGTTVFSNPDGNGIVTVTCHTGTAKYKLGQLTSENIYIAELQKQTLSAFA